MRESALDAQYASIELWKGRVGKLLRSFSGRESDLCLVVTRKSLPV